eukprot:373229-Pelagomonas_calceolata.AAC.1
METVLARLERVADRLERGVGIAIPQASATSPTPSAATIPSVSAAPAPQQHHTQSSTFLHDYDTLLAECLKPLVSLSSQINPEAQAAVKHLEKAFLVSWYWQATGQELALEPHTSRLDYARPGKQLAIKVHISVLAIRGILDVSSQSKVRALLGIKDSIFTEGVS